MADQVLNYAISGDSSGATAAFKDVAAAIQRAEDKADKFSATVDKLKESFARQTANMSQHSAAVERSVAGVGAQTQATGFLINSTNLLSGAVQTAVGALAAYGATQVVGWMQNQASAALEYGAALQDLSDRYDISTRDIQIFATWAELSGASTEEMARAVGKLEKNLAEGSKELAKFGVTALNGKDAFLQLAAAVQNAPSHIERVEIASAALGKGWESMMPVLNAGADALQEMANSADLIDAESIQRLAEMDDKVMQLQQSFRTLGAEIVAAFAPSTFSAIDFLRRKLKDFNDEFVRREDDKWVERLGGRYVSQGTYDLSNLKSLDGLSSKDIAPLLQGRRTNRGMVNSDGTFRVDSAVMDQAASAYNAALEREALEAQQSRLDKLDEAQAIRDRRNADAEVAKAEKERQAREKEYKSELQFLSQMTDQLALLQASADQRELIALDQKYANLREKHKANKESILAIEMAHQAELQNFHMQQNFGRLGRERDAEAPGPDEQSQMPPGGPQEYRYNNKYQFNPIPEASLGSALTNAPDYMKENWDRRNSNPDEIKKEYQAFLEEMQAATDGMVDSLADRSAGVLGPALIDAFTAPQDAIENLGEAGLAVLDSLAREVSTVIAKWLILKALSAGFGTSEPVGLGEFFVKSIGGHAAGTLSSPGGLRYLGERGPEPFETPYGQRGVATYGLYQVPAGTRVQSAGGGAPMASKEFHLHTTEADPIQVGEIFRRVVREEIMILDSEKYRGRQFD